MIDSPVVLRSVWRRGGEILSSKNRFNISTVRMIRPSIYCTTLSISPLSNMLDNGQYNCQSVSMSSAYILYTDASHQVTLRIGGKN